MNKYSKIYGFSQLIMLLLCCFLRTTSMAQVNVVVELDTTTLTIGDQTKLHISVTHNPNVVVQFPVIPPLGELEIFNPSGIDSLKQNNAIILTQDYTVQAFDSGYYDIPAMPFHYTIQGGADTVYSNRIPLQVNTINVDTSYVAPIKDIIGEPLKLEDFMVLIIVSISILAALLLAYILYRYKTKEVVVVPPKPKEPAHVIALRKLSKIREGESWKTMPPKTFQSELTYVFREYLENRYGIEALEYTSAEVMAAIKELDIRDLLRADIRQVLEVADLVKFAKATPEEEWHLQSIHRIESFVEETKKKLVIKDDNDETSN